MKAKFICEGCNRFVDYDADVCKYCGKKFIAVRCPKCGLVDNPEIFLSRCPSCGYESTIKIGEIKRKSYDNKKKKRKKSYIPLWVYKASGVLIFLLIVILIFFYLNSL